MNEGIRLAGVGEEHAPRLAAPSPPPLPSPRPPAAPPCTATTTTKTHLRANCMNVQLHEDVISLVVSRIHVVKHQQQQ